MDIMQLSLLFGVWSLAAFIRPVTPLSAVIRRRTPRSMSVQDDVDYMMPVDHSRFDNDYYHDDDDSTNLSEGNYAKVFGNLLKEDAADSLVAAPLMFFYSRKNDATENNGLNDKNLQKTVAECVLTHKEKSEPVSKTVYLSLRDAEEYGKRLEDAKHQKGEEPSIGGIKLGVDSTLNEGVELKCKSVVIEDETKKCNACLYVEVLIPSKHVRYGHVGSASILECLNGYDNGLKSNSVDRPYFINSQERYHPVCIV